VRSALADSEAAYGRRANAVAARAAVDARVGAAGAGGLGELLSALGRSCPDAPVAGDPAGLSLVLLLHYICGFPEEAMTGDWWPDDGAEPDEGAEPDWESMRLAALCELVSEAEAATEAATEANPRV
jgi:Family of unknown function (DUF6401)